MAHLTMSPPDMYRDRVYELAARRDGEVIFNGSTADAATVMEAMFRHARESVSILTGSLNPRVYGTVEVVRNARNFLSDPDHRLRIILEENDEQERSLNPFFAIVLRDASENAEVRYAPSELQRRYDFHFSLMDHDSYRFEEDRRKPAAIAVFGNRDNAANLESVFDKMWAWSGR